MICMVRRLAVDPTDRTHKLSFCVVSKAYLESARRDQYLFLSWDNALSTRLLLLKLDLTIGRHVQENLMVGRVGIHGQPS